MSEIPRKNCHSVPVRAERFVAVNGAALTDSIIESELFGHVIGAFTGAIGDKPGRFALASDGTLFLDEIGDLSPMGQADLLCVLEDGIYRPIGSSHTLRADARIIAATNRNRQDAYRSGAFREDLLYRLNVVVMTLPLLRDRLGAIAQLSAVFLHHFCARHKRPLKRLSPAKRIHPEAFEKMTLAEIQKEMVRHVLARCGGNKSEAARRLGINHKTLLHHAKSLEVMPEKH